MSSFTGFLLYDYKDLKVLLKSGKKVSKIIPLNAKIYIESLEHFSADIVQIYRVNDEFKKKIVSEAYYLQNIFIKKINKVSDLSESTKSILIFRFSTLIEQILGCWSAITDVGITFRCFA